MFISFGCMETCTIIAVANSLGMYLQHEICMQRRTAQIAGHKCVRLQLQPQGIRAHNSAEITC